MATITTATAHEAEFNTERETKHDDSMCNVVSKSIPSYLPLPSSPSDVSSMNGPVPNPPFVFPARPASPAQASFSRTTRRRPMSAYDVPRQSELSMDFKLGGDQSIPPPLPSFSFNPSGSSSTDAHVESPPHSPISPTLGRPIPSRSAGHRRGGSEFIGGDGKSGAGSLLSTSPTKSSEPLPLPNPTLGPSAGRRGHAHRRSAAISCHDLSMVMKPQILGTSTHSGSAPTSPSDGRSALAFTNSVDNAVQSDATTSRPAEAPDTAETVTTPLRQPKTARVGFSDNIEFIPRPLSLVSSDASSTMTIRQGHSVSGSLSSLISLSAPSPPSKEQRILPSAARASNTNEDRPNTAGPVLGSTQNQDYFANGHNGPRRRNSDPTVPEEAFADGIPLTPRTASKRYFFFGQDTGTGDGSPSRPKPLCALTSDSGRNERSSPSSTSPEIRSVGLSSEHMDMPILARRNSATRKPSKKQKKVKSWAGSILSRKAKPRSHKQKSHSRRSSTPPMRNYEPALSGLSQSIVTPTSEEHSEQVSHNVDIGDLDNTVQTNFANWKPKHISNQDDDSMSPIIDLDAALGPFNTPTCHDLDWEASQKSFGPTKRKMHSAAGMKNFKGPGLHYHRRAESAPEMVAFDNPRFGLHHIGSSSTMEDVFEEDEEDDDWEEIKTVSHKGSTIRAEDDDTSGLGIRIKVVNAESGSESIEKLSEDQGNPWQRGLKRKTSALSDAEGLPSASSMNSIRSVSPLRETFTMDDLDLPPRIGNEAVTRPVSSSRSSVSSLTPPIRAKDISPLDVLSNTPQPPYLTPTTPNSTFHSPFPSPRSPISYETQHISTAASSLMDEPGFNPLWLGGPGPEIRMSVDDVPSLTSSNSTMTRESMINPAFGNSQFRNGQRSVSLSGPAVSHKRSSIASLSRLLSSHGERSKLSIEERAPETHDSKKESKGKRISRMMQFWKPSKQDSAP